MEKTDTERLDLGQSSTVGIMSPTLISPRGGCCCVMELQGLPDASTLPTTRKFFIPELLVVCRDEHAD